MFHIYIKYFSFCAFISFSSLQVHVVDWLSAKIKVILVKKYIIRTKLTSMSNINQNINFWCFTKTNCSQTFSGVYMTSWDSFCNEKIKKIRRFKRFNFFTHRKSSKKSGNTFDAETFALNKKFQLFLTYFHLFDRSFRLIWG